MNKKTAQFRVLQNKSLEITGTFEIVNAKGEVIRSEGPAYLCRCGHSSKKPFCDGSHLKANFSG